MKDYSDFIKIAQSASTEDLREIIADCEDSDMQEVRADIKAIYEKELKKRQDREKEVEHWENYY